MVAGPPNNDRFGRADLGAQEADTPETLDIESGRILGNFARQLAARIAEVLELDDPGAAVEPSALYVSALAAQMPGAGPADFTLAAEAVLEQCMDADWVREAFSLEEDDLQDGLYPDALSGHSDVEGAY